MYCVNPKVNTKLNSSSSNSNNTTQNDENQISSKCSNLCSTRSCAYRNNVDKFLARQGSAGGDLWDSSISDVEDFINACSSKTVCPYYLSRELSRQRPPRRGRLVLAPYNYVFDDALSRSEGEDVVKGSIIVVDEGHNVANVCEDANSYEFDSLTVAKCIDECGKVREALESHDGGDVTIRDVELLTRVMSNLERVIISCAQTGEAEHGNGIKIYDLFRDAGVTFENHRVLSEFLRKVEDFRDKYAPDSSVGGSGGNTVSCGGLRALNRVILGVFGCANEISCVKRAECYVTSVERVRSGCSRKFGGGGNGGGRKGLDVTKVRYWCLSAAVGMRKLVNRGPRNVIISSGTLSPIRWYGGVLGAKFHEMLENDHVVDVGKQVFVGVCGRGIRKKILRNTYVRKDDPEQFMELGMSEFEARR